MTPIIILEKETDMNQTNTIRPQIAAHIPFRALDGKEAELKNLLSSAGPLVAQGEPETLQWFSLCHEDHPRDVLIIDFFSSPKGRNAHFAGQVAAALKEASLNTVERGWENGIVANIQSSEVLSALVREKGMQCRFATMIELKARAGQEEKLAELFRSAAAVVANTEEQTLLWYGLRVDKENFVIFDAFASIKGRDAHFEGEVAAALKAKAGELVEGGWEQGVLAHINHYKILSSNL